MQLSFRHGILKKKRLEGEEAVPIYNEQFIPIRCRQDESCRVKAAGLLQPDSSYMIQREGSSTIVLASMLSGSLWLESGGRRTAALQGDSFVLPARLAYRMYAGENPPSMVWVNLEGPLPELLIPLYFPDPFPILAACSCEKLLRRMLELAGQESVSSEIPLLCHQILLSVRDAFRPQSPAPPQSFEKQMEQQILNGIQAPFSAEALARSLGVSAATLSRSFREKLGCTPYQYYQSVRLDIARSLLRNTALSLEDIASRLNFCDRNHFSAFFTAREGVSPARYRKETRAES